MTKPIGFSDAYIKRLALLMTVNCVRNTVIEDYHARGSLSEADMKQFNKEVSNKIFTFLHYFFRGTMAERNALIDVAGLMYPTEWDQPTLDKGMKKAIKTYDPDRCSVLSKGSETNTQA